MKIRGLCIVKNESDVIEESLEAASRWADEIFVWDNGSIDGTWDAVQSLAQRNEVIVPFKQDGRPFRDGLRAEIYQHFRHLASEGDWWFALPADELYIDDPRLFLAKVPAGDSTVWTTSFSYYFTDRDLARFQEDPARYGPEVSVLEKLRYYLNHWSEIRFFRHDPAAVWSDTCWPVGLEQAPAFPVRIWVRHFAYRSPDQIDLRLRTRAPLVASGVFGHEAIPGWADVIDPAAIARDPTRGMDRVDPTLQATWSDRVVDASHLDYDAHDNRFTTHEELMPPLPSSSLQGAAAGASRSRRTFPSLRHSGRRKLRQL